MKEDNGNYMLVIYRKGEITGFHKDLSYLEAQAIYNEYDPFRSAGVDVYRNGIRMTFGEAMDKFREPLAFVVI